MNRVVLWGLVLLGIIGSCAIPEPPPGGPEDTSAARISATIPSAGSTGVDVTSVISFTFSEKMKKSRVERLVTVWPPIEFGKVTWQKNTLVIAPASPLADDTTYFVALKEGFRDYHNVPSEHGFQFAFATSAHLDSGSISGKVFFRRQPSTKAVVRCFRVPRDSIFLPEAERPDREVRTDEKGFYTFSYLPTANDRFVVWAFQDQNGNGYFEKGTEFGEVFADTIMMTGMPAALTDADITIIDPTEPGSIKGVVENLTGFDAFPTSVGLYTVSDTLPPTYYTFCDAEGAFEFKSVKSGSYHLIAMIDFETDSICGMYRCLDDSTKMCVEPCYSFPDSVRLRPGQTMTLETINLYQTQEGTNGDED